MKLLSPAKINLYLEVLSKRPDGYHELHTLFERVGLFDEITLLPERGGRIRLETASREVPKGRKNIVYRAAELLKEGYGVKEGVSIRLKKRIPVAAGLGGGSSNAAAVLIGLNRLWELGLGRKELLKEGAKLGSDVPFFILGTPFAVGRGRGEVLKKVDVPGAEWWHVIVKPPFGISTKEAYARLKPSALTPSGVDARMLVRSVEKRDKKGLSRLLTNSLELALIHQVAEIHQIKRELSELGALGSLMSGSGSSVFGIFSGKRQAMAAARVMKRHKRYKVFVAATF